MHRAKLLLWHFYSQLLKTRKERNILQLSLTHTFTNRCSFHKLTVTIMNWMSYRNRKGRRKSMFLLCVIKTFSASMNFRAFLKDIDFPPKIRFPFVCACAKFDTDIFYQLKPALEVLARRATEYVYRLKIYHRTIHLN